MNSFGVGDSFGYFVRLSTFWSWINGASDHFKSSDLSGLRRIVFTSFKNSFSVGIAATEATRRENKSEEAEAHELRDFFHKGVVIFRSVKGGNQTTGWFVESGFPIFDVF